MENEEGRPGRARTVPAENELAANIPRCVSSVWPVLARVLAAAQVRGGVPSESWVPGSLWVCVVDLGLPEIHLRLSIYPALFIV